MNNFRLDMTEKGQKCGQESYDQNLYPRRSDGEVLKPCMVCTQTRMERDTCISNKVKIYNKYVIPILSMKGKDSCLDLIEKHNECMKKMGFKTPKYL